jgi:bifunctional non-homologous end joining protein LigD
MLARLGSLPTRGDWAYEVKRDGFRAIVSTEGVPLRVRSRRGWDMTKLVPELAAPFAATFDGELVAFDLDGAPAFPLVCERMLMRRRHIPVVFVIFDVLCLDGRSLVTEPYRERRRQLEGLGLNSMYWRTPETFDDGEALFEAVCERELEGIVAKRVDGRYIPGYRAGRKSRTEAIGGTSSSASRRSTGRV